MTNIYAEIENDVVTNLVIAGQPLEQNWVPADKTVGIGYTYKDGVFSPPVITADPQKIRNTRNRLLAESDWTQIPDAPVDQLAWRVYRQALRDITAQPGFPDDIVWPTPPK